MSSWAEYGGFSPRQIKLEEMVETPVPVKKIVIIGDGMSGKTQILLTFSRLIIQFLHAVASTHKQLKDEDILHRAELALGGSDFQVSPAFQQWAEQFGFIVQYGRIKWDISSISTDTETIGYEDFHFSFPYVWNGKTFRVDMLGSDVGGQNIFDHMRNVMGKIAGVNDVLVVVFDHSRALSCWNSVQQVKNVVEEKISLKKDIPQLVYCANKIDLEQHIRSERWQNGVIRAFKKTLKPAGDYGKGSYQVPSIVAQKAKANERTINFELDQSRLAFPDLEAFFYNAIRDSDPDYGRLMTDVNSKALAREIAAQLVYKRKIETYQVSHGNEADEFVTSFVKEFGMILFQRRPLAIQYSGGIEYMAKRGETDTFSRVRKKWGDYLLDVGHISENSVRNALLAAADARTFLEQMGKFFSTNALQGEGVLNMIDSIIVEKLKKIGSGQPLSKPSRTLRRRIKKF